MHKKRPCRELTLQGLIFSCFPLFSHRLRIKGFAFFEGNEDKRGCTGIRVDYFPLSRIAACAAAKRATGTRKGEQDT